MARELSGILEHVEQISALDLDGVEPTSHVVQLENVLRPDEPRPSWPRETVLELAPDPADGSFRVPSPQADRWRDLLELTVAEAAAEIARRRRLAPPSTSRPTARRPPATT